MYSYTNQNPFPVLIPDKYGGIVNSVEVPSTDACLSRFCGSCKPTKVVGTVMWNRTPIASVPWIWHKESLYDALAQCSNFIFTATQRRQGNWIIASLSVCNTFECLAKFNGLDGDGVQKIGSIGEFAVYQDVHYASRNFLMVNSDVYVTGSIT